MRSPSVTTIRRAAADESLAKIWSMLAMLQGDTTPHGRRHDVESCRHACADGGGI